MNGNCFSSLLFLVILAKVNSLRPGGKNVKTTYQRYYVYQQTTTKVLKYKRTCTQTCDTHVLWCWSHKTVCKNNPYYVWSSTYKTVSRTRPIYSCYSGWLPRGDGCTIPICTSVCQNGGTCISPNRCRCRSGWTGSSCRTDVDECRSNRDSCGYKPGCRNTQGSYRCTCRVGYFLASDHLSCIDVNECTGGRYTCGANTHCVNNPGSYSCQCNNGYTKNTNMTNTCKDINECDPSSGVIHGCQGTCNNFDGSYNCSCPRKYYLASNGKDCTDKDECSENDHGCQQKCNNYPGGFNCTCYSGYRKNRTDFKKCDDMNECSEKTAGCAQVCTNTIGSFKCSCTTGYYLGTDLKYCNDFDECSTGPHNCEHNCLNTLGSYHCTCRAGFDLLLNGRNCSGRSCFPIYTPMNGEKKCLGYTTEHICHFTCLPGYDLTGSRNRTCSSSKIWTGEETKCKIIHCPTPTEPRNGFVYSPCVSKFDSQCTVGCSSGYYINDTNKFTCNANGAWQPRNLTCREIRVCQPNPCLHGGVCSSISSNQYSCDCTHTGYKGTDCDVGSIIIPDFPTITAGVPSLSLAFQASPPSDSIILILTGQGMEFNPSQLIFQKGGSRSQYLKITVQEAGLYFIRYSLSGPNAGEFQSPQQDVIFVRSKYTTTETPENKLWSNKFPSGCHKQLLDKCPHTNDVILAASTTPWVTFGRLTMTKGVVNVEIGATNIPLSLVGTNLVKPTQISAPKRQCSKQEVSYSTEQFTKSHILTTSFLNAVNESFPKWLTITLRNSSSLDKVSISELKTSYLAGKYLLDSDIGEGQPINDKSFYSLLSSQNLNLTIGKDVDLLGARHWNAQLSLAVDLCSPAPKNVIIRPSLEHMDLVNNNSMVKNVRENGWNIKFYSLQISKKKLIKKLAKGLFWNSKRFFEVSSSTIGNLGIVTSFVKSFKSTTLVSSSIEFEGTIVAEFNNIENILDTPLDQEWKVDLYGNITLTAAFEVKGKITKLILKAPHSLSYATFGGNKQKGCHTDANYDPQGLFLTTTLHEDPFVHSELRRFVELGSNKTIACFLDTAIYTNNESQLSKYAERNDGVVMTFHGHIKFGPLQFQNLEIQIALRNSDCSKATNSSENTAVELTGEPNQTRQRKFGIFELSPDMAYKLQIRIPRAQDSNFTGSFQSTAKILGFKNLVKVDVSDKGIDFATSGKIHGLFEASMRCSSALATWNRQSFTVAGEFDHNSAQSSIKDALKAELNKYAVQMLKKAMSRVAAAKETEQRAKVRLENVLLIKNNAFEKLQRSSKEYLSAERILASAMKDLAYFEQAANNYSADVDELKKDLDVLCTVKECPDVCQEGVVCTTCYHDVIGKTMGMCSAMCLITVQRRLPPYTEVVLCESPKCTRIHNTNGLFKKLLGKTFGNIVKGVLSFGITAVATVLGAPPPVAAALGSGLVTLVDTGRVNEVFCSIGKAVVTSFIGGPSASKVLKQLGKVSVKEGIKQGSVVLGRKGASFLVGKAISCQREQKDGSWNCRTEAVPCIKDRFQYEYEHFPYGCKKSCEKERVTKTIKKSCCSNLSCASFIVNITCVAENVLCKQARKDALDQISKTRADAAKILRNLAGARQNVSYWKMKKQKEHMKLMSASRSFNASQEAAHSLEKAYNVTVEARKRKLEIFAKPLKLRELFDERMKSMVMVKIENIRFNVKVMAGHENTLLPIYITFKSNKTRETLATVLDFKRLNTSFRSIANEILGISIGDLSSVSRKRRSVEETRDSGYDQRFWALKNYHRRCSEITNYEQTLYNVVSSLQNLSSEARSLQEDLRKRNQSSSFNASDVLTRFSANQTMILKYGIVLTNVSYIINHRTTDPELSEAIELKQQAIQDGRQPLHLGTKLLIYNWYAIMEDIFNKSSIANECSGLEDCLMYTIDNLYEIYSDIDIPEAPQVRKHISAINTKLAELTQSVGMSVDDATKISTEIVAILQDMAQVNEICASPPNITKHPESFTEIGVGKILSLTCNATGSALVYKWRFNGDILQDQSTNVLLITNATISSTGNYTCEVSNYLATDTSIPASVTVHPPPSIILQPVDQLSVTLTTDGFLQCLAESSNRNITYQWWFKSVNSTSFLALQNETFPYLNFEPVKATHEGVYFCNVSNAYGSSISRTSFVKALHFTLPVPGATLSLIVKRLAAQNNAIPLHKLSATSYEKIRSRISEMLSSFGNRSSDTTVKHLHPVTYWLRNSRNNKSRDSVDVCQWEFRYMGKNETSYSSVNDEFEINARKVINASLDVKQEVGELANATNTGSLSFSFDNQTYVVEKHSLSVQNFYLYCPHGQTLVQEDFKCVDCPPGTYGELDEHGIATCQLCPLSSYQTNSGQPSCVKCPKGFTTVNQGSYNKDQCKVICPAGHYGVITENIGKCLPCPVNTYQRMEGQSTCLACPKGHATNTEGTMDAAKCLLEPTRGPTEAGTSKITSPVATKMPGEPTVEEVSTKEGPNGPMIAGVVVAIVVIILIVLVLLYLYRRRQQNKMHNDHQTEEGQPPKSPSPESSDMRYNAAYTLEFNYHKMGDATNNPIYDSAYDPNSSLDQELGIENPTHDDIVMSEGSTLSSHTNPEGKPRNFTNQLFQYWDDEPNKSAKMYLSDENMVDEAV